MRFNRRGFMIAAAMLAVGSSISPSFAAAQGTGDPKAIVQGFYDALEETMKQGTELGFDGRYKKLEPVIHETFDVPVMETRWVFHRMDMPLDGVPHFDMLHSARRTTCV